MFPTIIDAGNSYIGLFKFVAKVESFCHWIYKNLQFPSLGEIFFLITYKSLVVYNINDTLPVCLVYSNIIHVPYLSLPARFLQIQ